MKLRLLSENDFQTGLSKFQTDPNNRLVTDSEKNNWNSKLSSVYGADISRSKAKGYNTSNTWQSLSSTRDLEDWIGDFDKRTRENKTAIDLNKTNIDSLSSRIGNELVKEKDVRRWAAEIANADLFFSEQNKLGQMINDSYGTNLSTNIRNLDDLINSTTALKSTFSNANATKYTAKSMLFYEKLANNAGAMNVLLDTPSAMSLVVEEAGALGMLAQSTVALDEMYKRKKTLRFKEEVSGGKYIVLNARHARSGSSVYTAKAYYLVPNGDYTESEAPLERKYVNLKRRHKYYIKLNGGESSLILLEYLEIK